MNTKRLVSVTVFTALIIVGGLVSVPIPFTQVELSFQTVFVISAGLLLGGRDGALAVLVYVAMGLFGLPVFTQGGGPQYVLMPSFGYLVGFILGALVCGAVNSRIKYPTRGRAFLCALIGCVPIYVLGIAYQVLILYFYLGNTFAAAVTGIPAVCVLFVKDATLVGLVSMIYPSLDRALKPRRKSHGMVAPLSSRENADGNVAKR